MALSRSKKRIADHGEVFTPAWLVDAMLDLAKGEAERIDSRFLEPACGSGNFLIQILQRRLATVESKYGSSDLKRQHYALLGLMCLYGIELLPDNIVECRGNLLEIFAEYLRIDSTSDLYQAASYVLMHNLVHGDALKMRDHTGEAIIFAEWGYLGRGRFQRRNFRFDALTQSSAYHQQPPIMAQLDLHEIFSPASTHPPTTIGDMERARSDSIGEKSMQFDVIVGNPPYQLADGGGEGASAVSLYHRFVKQAKALDPRQIIMVIPARWYTGGKGLNEFRANMLTDGKLVEIHDFPETDLVFPGVNIRGGVCYFRWAQSHGGPARITNYSKSRESSTAVRPMLEPGLSTFVRSNEAVSILKKVREKGEQTYNERVQSRNPFGIPSAFSRYSTKRGEQATVRLFRSRRGSHTDKEVFITPDKIRSNLEFKDRIKVLVSKASPGGDEYPHAIFSAPIVAPTNSVSTETYLIVDFPNNKDEARHLVGYMRTRFFRFMVSLIKTTQHISKGSFAFVPVQDLSVEWTDEKLYEKYGISEAEAAFIDTMIRA